MFKSTRGLNGTLSDILSVYNMTNIKCADNGEWILVGMPVTKFITKYRCCPEPYPFITYNIVIRRRTMYYILNFLTPCVLMSALTILGFFLPVESGERMNVGVTVLLSLTVILLLLAEELPATSEVVPLTLKSNLDWAY